MSKIKKARAGDESEKMIQNEHADGQEAVEATEDVQDVQKDERESDQDNDSEFANLQDRYLRVLAEYENYRKRTQKEKQALYAEAIVDVAKEWLDVVDNIERAICHSKDVSEGSAAKVAEGIEMVYKQALEVMERLGIKEIPCEQGQCFDPEMHEAVMHIEDDTLGEHCVAEVFKKGYQTDDRIIRHSIVKVAN